MNTEPLVRSLSQLSTASDSDDDCTTEDSPRLLEPSLSASDDGIPRLSSATATSTAEKCDQPQQALTKVCRQAGEACSENERDGHLSAEDNDDKDMDFIDATDFTHESKIQPTTTSHLVTVSWTNPSDSILFITPDSDREANTKTISQDNNSNSRLSEEVSGIPGKHKAALTMASSRDLPRKFCTRKTTKRLRDTKITDYFLQKKKTRAKAESGGKNILNQIIFDIKNEGIVLFGDNNSVNENGPSGSTVPTMVRFDKNMLVLMKDIHVMVSKLYKLRDNGAWSEFEENVRKAWLVVPKEIRREMQAFLLIEDSIALSYKRMYNESEKRIEEAKKLIDETPGLILREVLVAMRCTQHASLHRRAGRINEASRLMTVATQNLEFFKNQPKMHLIWGMVLYEAANTFYVQDGRKSEAVDIFKRCITHCEAVRSENPQIYMQRDQYARLKVADLKLESNTSTARHQSKIVSEADILEAEKCIVAVQNRPGGESQTMLRLSVESALHRRRDQYIEAKNCLQKASVIAERIGFGVQYADLDQRFREITILEEEEECHLNG